MCIINSTVLDVREEVRSSLKISLPIISRKAMWKGMDESWNKSRPERNCEQQNLSIDVARARGSREETVAIQGESGNPGSFLIPFGRTLQRYSASG